MDSSAAAGLPVSPNHRGRLTAGSHSEGVIGERLQLLWQARLLVRYTTAYGTAVYQGSSLGLFAVSMGGMVGVNQLSVTSDSMWCPIQRRSSTSRSRRTRSS